MTYEEYRGYCKLHFGVPILRRDHEDYREVYDREVRHLPYEIKLRMMMIPIDAAVTRDMTKKQMDEFLYKVQEHFTDPRVGMILTQPQSDMFYE